MNKYKKLRALLKNATKAPWFFVCTDDDSFMNARYVGTIDRGQRHDNQQGMNGERAEEIIACTLYQLHPGIEIDDGNWNENAALIAEMRNEVESILDKYDAIIDTASKLTLASNDHTFNCDCSSCVSWEKLNELLVQDE